MVPRYISGVNFMDIVINEDSSALYPPNMDCYVYIVSNSQNTWIRLTWMRMDMEPKDSAGNCRDYVQLFSVDPVTMKKTGELTERLCGHYEPPVMNTTETHLMVHAVTGSVATTTKTGFDLEYRKLYGILISSTPTQTPTLTSWEVIVTVVACVLLIVLVVLVVLCVRCCYYHNEDICLNRWRRNQTPYLVESYYPPSPQLDQWITTPTHVRTMQHGPTSSARAHHALMRAQPVMPGVRYTH